MKGYRTVIWNLANAVVLIMAAVESTYQVPGEWTPYWIGIYIAGNLVLRLVTTGPVGGES